MLKHVKTCHCLSQVSNRHQRHAKPQDVILQYDLQAKANKLFIGPLIGAFKHLILPFYQCVLVVFKPVKIVQTTQNSMYGRQTF